MTGTTPLNLDAAIEAAWRGYLHGGGTSEGEELDAATMVATANPECFAAMERALTAIGYPALVEENERLREVVACRHSGPSALVHRDLYEQMRAERDAAIARAEALDTGMRSLAAENLELMNRARDSAIARDEALAKVAAGLAEVARLEIGLATVSHAGCTHGSAHPGPAALCGSDFCRQVASNIPHYGPGGDLS